MKKLTKEHLAPYLLYKLKVKDLYDGSTRTLMGININHTEPIKVAIVGRDLAVSRKLEEIKPRLRPLWDLFDKKTDHLEFLKEYFHKNTFKLLDEEKEICTDSIKTFITDCYRNDKCYPLDFWNYLFENHFDVLELIPKGLAIDKNTLEK